MNLRMEQHQVTKDDIEAAITTFGYSARTLVHALTDGPKYFMRDIHAKVNQLRFVDLGSLVRLDAENTGKISHSLVVSRCLDQPGPSTLEYLGSDVLSSGVASPAVWTVLLEVHGRGVLANHEYA